MKTEDITTENLKLKVVAYGQSGSGKSRFLGTFPKSLYVFDTDDGMLSLRGMKDIEYDTYQDEWRSGIRTRSGWASLMEKLKEQALKGWPFSSYAFDSYTTLSDLCVREMAVLNKHVVPIWEDYGKAVGPMKFLLGTIRAIPRHVIITAHEELIRDSAAGTVSYIPAAIGKELSPLLELMFDEVYRMQVRQEGTETWYRLLTKPDVNYHAKSRLGCLSGRELPDFQVIMEKVKGEKR